MMKNTALFLGAISVTLVMAVAPAFAMFPEWDLKGTWNFNYYYGGTYVHTMVIDTFDKTTGEFTGHGQYNADPCYTWTVSGEETGNSVDYSIVYNGCNAGYQIDATGTISSNTFMSGDATASGGQAATWDATGNVAPIMNFLKGGAGIPKGSKLVLNIVHWVRNDEDSGNVGYWALDNYVKHVKVWQDPGDSTKFYVIATYDGIWSTFKGALSPGTGAAQSKPAIGTMHGGYIGTFTATGMTSAKPKFGFAGIKNYGGTRADVLLGTYGAGQTGPTTPFSYLSTYFTDSSGFNYYRWGWTYRYRNQVWSNFDSGTTGDIVV